MRSVISGISLFVLMCLSCLPGTGADDALRELTTAANQFLNSLPPELQQKASLGWEDEERLNWHYVPKERPGVSFKELDEPQKLLAHALLSSALSAQGAMKAVSIMFLDKILHDLEQSAMRDYEAYYITFFGKPDAETSWGFRLEGHHLSLNFTVKEGQVVSTTPLFMGANPARVPQGPHQGMQVLRQEEELARQLVTLLNEEQRQKAVFDQMAPSEIITRAERRVSPLEPKGLPVSEMNEEQQQLFRRLLEEYVQRVRPEFAGEDLRKIREAGMEKLSFAWAGGMEPGAGHYYRLQGPSFVMEYDNTQNDANHVHTVWRDFDGDFGADVLAEHYRQDHQDAGESR